MTRLVLGGTCVAVLLLACGGSTDDGLTGSGTGGASTGGASTGGASSGGASSGGGSTGGASTGGASTGGMSGMGGMGTGGMGTGGMGTGGMGTGGMGTGGTGGGTSTTCTDLASKYLAALDAAKSCNPMLSVIQCDKQVPNKIVCACTTYVNHNNQTALGELAKLQEQWNQLGCGKNVACPEIACIEPQSAVCATSGPSSGGKCKDVGL